MTLAEFLLARLAEDETEVKERYEKFGEEPESWCDRADGLHLNTAQVLADVESKRRIVGFFQEAVDNFWVAEHSALRPVIKQLAVPYADHPDYLEEWAP